MPLAERNRTARYKDVTEEKAEGATFTPKRLAAFVARGRRGRRGRPKGSVRPKGSAEGGRRGRRGRPKAAEGAEGVAEGVGRRGRPKGSV